MTKVAHAERAHAILSASSSDRWLNCEAAPRLEEAFADESSVFAAEGTKAHELAERTLVSGRNAHEVEGDYPLDMREFVQQYVDYVRAIDGERLIEQRMNFSQWVPEGFGTADAVILNDGVCHVCDLKYGKGLKVDAEENTQMMLYALGAYHAYDAIYGPITKFVLHICQPRLDHFDSWEVAI